MDFALLNGFSFLGLDFSPVKGPKGNIEYLCLLKKSDNAKNFCGKTAEQVVDESYNKLNI